MALQAPTIILFDMDGTVVHHINPRLLNILEALDDFAYKCAKCWRWLRRRKLYNSDTPRFERKGKRPGLIVHRAMHKLRRKPVERLVEPCPGMLELLQFIYSCGLPTAVVSNGLGEGYGHDILRKFELEPYFNAGIFCESLDHSKPHPDPLLKAIAALDRDITPDDVIWYIGDRYKDVHAAMAVQKHLDCTIQPLVYGIHGTLAILEHGKSMEHVITSYYELIPRLKDLLDGPKDTNTDGDKVHADQ
jgi:phosphoglycolate phosphatase